MKNSVFQDLVMRLLFTYSLINLNAFLGCKRLVLIPAPIGLKQELEPRTHPTVQCFNHEEAGYSWMCASLSEGINSSS